MMLMLSIQIIDFQQKQSVDIFCVPTQVQASDSQSWAHDRVFFIDTVEETDWQEQLIS